MVEPIAHLSDPEQTAAGKKPRCNEDPLLDKSRDWHI